MNPTPLSKAASKLIRKLSLKKNREETGLFVAEGEKVVYDLLSGGLKVKLLVTSDPDLFEKSKLPEKPFFCSAEEMRSLSSLSAPPGLLAVFHQPDETLGDVPESGNRFLIADGIKDPGNLGTLIRTAHWFGLDGVIALNGCADLYNPKTVQSTMGSLGRIPVIYPTGEDWLKALEKDKIPLLGADLKGTPINTIEPGNKFALVIGSESHGISQSLRDRIDHFVFVPPASESNRPESLNAAVSAGIILARLSLR
jgi:TrmH family RNA methyltransferase